MRIELEGRNAHHRKKARIACLLRPVLVAAVGLVWVAGPAHADEGAASTWLPGFFGSLAAAPGAPGWSLAMFYYHTSADAGASRNFSIGGGIVAGLDVKGDLAFFAPTYTFAQPVLGAQAALSVLGGFGRIRVSTGLGQTQRRTAVPADTMRQLDYDAAARQQGVARERSFDAARNRSFDRGALGGGARGGRRR